MERSSTLDEIAEVSESTKRKYRRCDSSDDIRVPFRLTLNAPQEWFVQKLLEVGLYGRTRCDVISRLIDEAIIHYSKFHNEFKH